VQQAVSTGKPVEIRELRTEYSRTFANPDGFSRRAEIGSTAMFGRTESGAFEPIDTTLEMRGGGIAPRVSAAPVTLPSGGGSTATIEFGKTELELDLPGDLGTPELDGPTATYRDVFPGVHLHLTATPEGMKEVFEVTSRKAAQAPQLRELVIPVRTRGATLRQVTGGGLAVVDHSGASVFQGPAPTMWDSTGRSVSAPADELTHVFGSGTSVPKRTVGPTMGDRVSRMGLMVGHGRLRVRPNAQMLNGAADTFPIYIDPMTSLDRSERLMIASSGFESWQFTGDEGMGRCPNTIAPAACSGSFIKRLYYEFGRGTVLNAGDEVLGAEFAVKETHSTSCAKRAVSLRQVNQISSSTAWPGPSYIRTLADLTIAHGWSSSCPDAMVEFRNATVKDAASDLASGSISRLTLLLRAVDESDEYAWKRFVDSAVLRVDFIRKPATPTAVSVLAGSAYTCGTSSTAFTLIGDQPTMRAQVQTAVEAAATAYKGDLKAKFELQRYDGPTAAWVAYGGYRYRPTDGATWVGDNTILAFRPSDEGIQFANNTLYRFRALTQSHFNATSEVSGVTRESPWSGYCYFKIDPDAPLPPVVSSVDGVYLTDDAEGIHWSGGPGIPGQFAFTQNAVDDDPNIKTFLSNVTDGAAITTTGTKSENATVTPATYGQHLLSVTARDLLDRNSLTAAYPFYVGPPGQPDGRWHVTASDTTSIANSGGLADSVTPSPLTLSSEATVSGVGTGRRGNDSEDRALSFSGGTAASDGVVKTEKAVSFSTWVRLADTTADATALWRGTADGGTGFALRYLKAANAWSFEWRTPGSATPVTATGTVVPKVWTLLTGTYDPTNHQLELFVNGRSVGTNTATTTATTGPLSLGGLANVPSLTPFRGLVDEPTVWQRTVPAEEAQILATTDFETGQPFYSLAASWSTLQMSGQSLADQSAFGGNALTPEGGALFDEPNRLVNLDGVDDALVTTGPVVDETASFTVQMNFAINSDALASKPVGYRARLAGQRGTVANGYSSWAVWFEKLSTSGTGRIVFGRWQPTATGEEPALAYSTSEPAVTGAIATINSVYDASSRTIRLYAGELLLAEPPYDPASQGTNELAVGKGYQAGGWGDRAPLGVKGIRIWAGALSADQLAATQGSEW
jgi:hypothetical protein